MSREKPYTLFIILNLIHLNLAQADDPFEKLVKMKGVSTTLTDEQKKETYDAERSKKINQLSQDGQKANSTSHTKNDPPRMTAEEKRLEKLNQGEEVKSKATAKAAEKSKPKVEADPVVTTAKPSSPSLEKKIQETPTASPASLPVKSEDALEELKFPGN